ncbi:MAG: hypothetical protein ACKVQC_04560 [Elusimicrobiota bacterium]
MEIKSIIKTMLFFALFMTGFSPVKASEKLFISGSYFLSLPTEFMDWSDLDIRDEFNRPVENKTLKQNFEDYFSSKIKNIFLENLSPLKQKWIVLFHEGLSQNFERFQSLVKKLYQNIYFFFSSQLLKNIFIVSQSFHASAQLKSHFMFDVNSFRSYHRFIIASTRLLL